MEILGIIAMMLLCAALILWVYKRYTGKSYAAKTERIANSAVELTLSGFKRTEHGYSGKQQGYDVVIYPTTTPGYGYMKGPMFQVWVIIAPQEGQLKGLGGFFGKYMVTGERPGYAMIGFALRHSPGTEQSADLLAMLETLIAALKSKDVAAYVAG